MRILFITPYKIPDGIARYTEELINTMHKKYVSFSIDVFSWNYPAKISRWFNPLAKLLEIKHKILSSDIIHIQYVASLYLWNLYFPLYQAKLVNKKNKIVITMHETNDNTPWPWFFNQLQNIYLDLADAIIVHSMYHKNLLPNKFDHKIHIIPLAVPEIDIGPVVNEDNNLILLPGFINQWKGYDLMIKALDVLKEKLPNLAILIVGKAHDIKYVEKLKQLVIDLNLNNRVEFKISFVPDEELNNYFSKAGLVVLPYRRITMSAILARSIVFEKAIIMSDLDPFIEYTQKQGMYFTSDNWQSLADKINLLINNPKLKEQQKILSQRLKLEYSQSRIIDRTVNLYKKLHYEV